MMSRAIPCLALFTVLSLPVSSQTTLVEEGDFIAGLGSVEGISDMIVNDAGEWLVEVDTDTANLGLGAALLENGSLVLQQGQALTAPSGATLESFGSITLNNNGHGAWNLLLPEGSGGVYLGSELLIVEGSLSTATSFVEGTTYTQFFQTKLDDTGRVLVLAGVDRPGSPSNSDKALVVLADDGGGTLVETVVAATGDVLPGQTEPVNFLPVGPHDVAFNDLGDVMFAAGLTGSSATNTVVYVNDEVKAQEGSPSPVAGRNWSSLGSAKVDLNDARQWVLSGSVDGSTASDSLIVKNGAKFRQEGDSLAAISPFVLTRFGTPVLIANSGEVLWYGDWNDPNTSVDTGLFVDDTLLVQEGVTAVDGVVIDLLRNDENAYAISPNGRYVVFEAVLSDGIWGAYMIDRGVVAHQELRNGSGVNPVCLKASTAPSLGGTWTVEIDSGAHPGATLALFEARDLPIAPQGGAFGELLIHLSPPSRLARAVAATGGVEVLTFPVPNNAAFIGRTVYTQALLFGTSSQLCNALDSTAGH